MKTMIYTSILLASFFAQASECEVHSYEQVFNDFTQTPKEMIIDASKKHGCDEDEVNKIGQLIDYKLPTKMQHGSSTYYSIETKGGIYQIMTSSMSEPPKAIIMYSRWD